MTIDEFNSLDAGDAREQVLVWAAIPSWADVVVAERPYASADALLDAAARSARDWGRADLDAALAHHPRIGERPVGTGAEAAASRTEQAGMTDADDDVTALIAAGNRVYEERFGRVFLIRAAGRSPEEMLGELKRRLSNDEDAEVGESLAQLTEIALLRARGDVIDTTPATTPAQTGIPS